MASATASSSTTMKSSGGKDAEVPVTKAPTVKCPGCGAVLKLEQHPTIAGNVVAYHDCNGELRAVIEGPKTMFEGA